MSSLTNAPFKGDYYQLFHEFFDKQEKIFHRLQVLEDRGFVPTVIGWTARSLAETREPSFSSVLDARCERFACS